MKLRNLKASFILKENVESLPKIKNVMFKLNSFTFTIYHHAPYLVNVTGVKSFERLKLAQKLIEEKMQLHVSKIRIDNMFFSQKNFANVDLKNVYNFMKNNSKFYVDYNVELFAGMYFHPKIHNYPTILFFRTGSYTMMGGKQMKILRECETFVKTLIVNFDKKRV